MTNRKINRREFVHKTTIATIGLATVSQFGNPLFATPAIKNNRIAGKVFVLGIDGMDPNLLKRFMAQGQMPTFQKFVENNHFGTLGTTLPPQSPVAWSSFITGSNPGRNGIFDFIHRDPKHFKPYLSTARSFAADKRLNIGDWSIPIKGGGVELMRRGTPFWEILEANDIAAVLHKMPANYPVVPSSSNVISGMGTPDLLGSYGTFTLFSETDIPNGEKMSGGRVVKIKLNKHGSTCVLDGPPNPLKADGETARIPFKVLRDPVQAVAKIEIQGHAVMLNQGEWSGWIPLDFEMMPIFSTLQGMVRIYMQQVHPHIRFYISPINVDPMTPSLPIASPDSYSEEVAQAIGRFYTQGFPEDTKALSNGIFTDEEFLQQSRIVLNERLQAFEYELNKFREGLFFFYFSSIDQNSHMMIRTMDSEHPLYDPAASPDVKGAIPSYYRVMDNVLRQTLAKMDSNSVLYLISDHGFAPFHREFHLSTWLVENGFTAVHDRENMHKSTFYDYVDWPKSKAYAMGLNGIYINLYGREANGAVSTDDYYAVKADLISKLQQIRDPKTGRKIILRAYDSRKIYSGPYVDIAPDIVIGYASGYRISDEAALGKFPKGIIGDRTDKWSSDHCMDPSVVPGVLLTNQDVKSRHPALWDIAPSILKGFGLGTPKEMDGKSII